MKYLANQDFGGSYRPGLVAAVANGTASQDEMNRIGDFVKALDIAKVATANQAAGIQAETSPQNADLLMSIGESGAVIQRANSAVSEGANPQAAADHLGNTFQTIATYAANTGDLIFPQPDSFAPGKKAPDGSSNDNILQSAWHGISTGLSWLGNIPGFVYRAVDKEISTPLYDALEPYNPLPGVGESAAKQIAADQLGLQVTNDQERALGYNPDSLGSDLSFLWSHGESDFSNLGPAIAAHGRPLVDTAIKMFQSDPGYASGSGNVNFQGALANYAGSLNADLRDGKITPEQYTAETQKFNDPSLEAAYNSVDASHASLGRDLARTFFDYDKNPGGFNFLSGSADLVYSLYMDPALAVGKAWTGVKAIRYGLETLGDTSRLSRLYGVADKVTGELPQKLNPLLNRGAISAQNHLDDFLMHNDLIRKAEADGRKADAAALYARNAARNPSLMPLYKDAQGWRLALTPEEITRAKSAGTTMSAGGDAVHEVIAPARNGATPELRQASTEAFKKASVPAIIGAKPWTTREEFVDYISDQAGLTQWLSGLAPRAPRVLPGMMGFAAEARAAALGKLAFNRTMAVGDSPLFHALATGNLNGLPLIDTEKDAAKIIPSDAGEAYKKSFLARLTGSPIGGRDADSWLGVGRSLRAYGDQKARRLTTLLPTNHAIAFNSTQASKDIERFARTFLSKDQAAYARYAWDAADSEAARRQVGRALVNSVVDASGITRSTVGRQWMEDWNAAFDDLSNVRYGLGDTDKVADIARGERRVAMNLSQIETHLILPPFTELRRVAAKAAIMGFDKPLDQLNSKGMLSWFKDANGDKAVMAGVKKMLASPTATVRYGLFNTQILTKLFNITKLGWLATTSNMLRQYAEEYTGLTLGGARSELVNGKRVLRLNDGTTALIAKAHHLVPHIYRPTIDSEKTLLSSITKGRLSIHFGDRPLDDVEKEAADNLDRHVTQPEVMELLGGRQATQAEGGVRDAIDAHSNNVPTQRVGWKKAKFLGYQEGALNSDAGKKALAAMYTNLFVDKDEPALRALAYHMWNHAADAKKGRAFLSQLDEDTVDRMHALLPVDEKTLKLAKARVAGKVAKGKMNPPTLQGIADYVRDAPEMGTFRQRSEWLRHDRTGAPITADDKVNQEDAINRYVASQAQNVGLHVYSEDGRLHPKLVSDLIRSKTPSEAELSKISLKDLPPNVVHAEFMPVELGRMDKIGETLTKAAVTGGKVFDAIVTNPMQRLERKPLFYGNYVKAYKDLQPYVKSMIENGFSEADAKGIADRLALGRGLLDTIKYLDNPKIASQLSAVAQNFWLFARAQEDFVRRWAGIVKERPETLRLAHMAVMGGVHSGMVYRDTDGNLQLAYPGSGAIIDAFMMAQDALGIGAQNGMQIPVSHDLTTQLNYLNPSLMNPVGFSATPMVTLPFDMLKAVIPGHDMLKSSIDMAFNGQLGNGRSWWEQFMPTEINRLVKLFGENNDTGSQVGSAAATTILNASLAGRLPDGATDDVTRQHQIADLKTQTLGAMFGRALFSFIAPGATSMPELDYKDANGNFIGDPNSDVTWRALGVKNLKDEYKALIQSVGVDKANVVWQELHPKYLPYTTGKTTVTASGANADPTSLATQWIFDNKPLFEGKYARVAAYFIPSAPGTFDQVGWNALQEIGVRQHKTLEQYYLDIATKNAVTQWYTLKDTYDQKIQQLKASGQRYQDVQAEYDAKKTQLKVEYPILTPYFDAHGTRNDKRTQDLGKLREMVVDPEVKLPQLAGVAKMFEVLDQYNSQMSTLKGQRSNWAITTREDLNSSYEANMADIVKNFPGLSDVYNSVFREQEQ